MTEPHRLPELVAGALLLALVTLSAAQDLAAAGANWDGYGPVSIDDPVPAFAVALDDGTQLDNESLEGRVTMLAFWATWCHACTSEMPTLVALDERFAGTDLRILGVNRDDLPMERRMAAVGQYTRERDIEFSQIYDDGQMARAFGVEAIPHLVLIDRNGRIRYMHLGQVGERTLAREIDELLEG